MGDPMIDTVLERLRPRLRAEDVAGVRTMLVYFGRASLWVSRIEDEAEPVELLVASETERYRLDLDEILRWYADLRTGIPFDWDALRRER